MASCNISSAYVISSQVSFGFRLALNSRNAKLSCRRFKTSAESTHWIDNEVSVSEGALEVVSLVILCAVSIVVYAINATVAPTGGALLAAIAFFVPALATISD